QATDDVSGEAEDAVLESLQIVDRLDLLAEPPAHLRACGTAVQAVDVVVLVELVHELAPASPVHPGRLLACVHAERKDDVEGESRILADIVATASMAKFDGAILNGIRDLQAGHDLTRCETANLEFLVGHLRQVPG